MTRLNASFKYDSLSDGHGDGKGRPDNAYAIGDGRGFSAGQAFFACTQYSSVPGVNYGYGTGSGRSTSDGKFVDPAIFDLIDRLKR